LCGRKKGVVKKVKKAELPGREAWGGKTFGIKKVRGRLPPPENEPGGETAEVGDTPFD